MLEGRYAAITTEKTFYLPWKNMLFTIRKQTMFYNGGI